MIKVDLFNIKAEKEGQIDLPAKIFGVKINPVLMAQAVRVYLANQRRAGAKVKDRGEVSGSTRKIWRQKGTGRARHGDRYAPIFVGGGVAHGPTGSQNFKLKMPKKMIKKALFSALSEKAKAKEITVIKGLTKIKPKTKQVAAVIDNFKLKKTKVLLILPQKEENIWLAGRNLADLEMVPADGLNTYQVLKAGRLILMAEAVERMKTKWI